MTLQLSTLHEPSRRHTTWRPGEPLDFGRAGVWWFPQVEVATRTLTTEAGSFLMFEFSVNERPEPRIHELIHAVTESVEVFDAGMDLCHYVMCRNYDLERWEFEILVVESALNTKDPSATSRRMMEIAYAEPVHGAARLVKSYPKIRPDRSGLVVGQN